VRTQDWRICSRTRPKTQQTPGIKDNNYLSAPMGSKKKRTRSAGAARTLKGNRAITLTAPEISRRVEPAELPYRSTLANSNKEIA